MSTSRTSVAGLPLLAALAAVTGVAVAGASEAGAQVDQSRVRADTAIQAERGGGGVYGVGRAANADPAQRLRDSLTGQTPALSRPIDREAAAVVAFQEAERPRSKLWIAKWSTLVLSTGLSVYGISVNQDADDGFREIEALCDDDPDRCEDRTAGGSFADQELETRFKEVVALDDRARTVLLAGQIGLGATVVLFVLDLTDRRPPNIPYAPPHIEARADGLFLTTSFPVGGR